MGKFRAAGTRENNITGLWATWEAVEYVFERSSNLNEMMEVGRYPTSGNAHRPEVVLVGLDIANAVMTGLWGGGTEDFHVKKAFGRSVGRAKNNKI